MVLNVGTCNRQSLDSKSIEILRVQPWMKVLDFESTAVDESIKEGPPRPLTWWYILRQILGTKRWSVRL